MCGSTHKIAIYYIYDTNTRWLLSCYILARMYKYTNKKTKSLKKTLSTDSYTHHQIVLVLIIYRNPLKSLGDFSSFSRFGYFRFLHSFMFAIFFMSFNFFVCSVRFWSTFLFRSLCRFKSVKSVYRFDFCVLEILYW